MTEEQKEELIQFNRAIIAQYESYAVPLSGCTDELRPLIASARIALTALTAPPVKLPDIEENETAFNAGLNALIDCLEDCGDAEQGLRLALRAIRAAGYEVQE